MGSDKAMLIRTPGDPPLYRQVAECLGRVASPVMLAPGVAGRLGATGYQEVDDAVAGGGPLAGLVAALEASPSALLAVVAVDMPSVSPAVIGLLAGLCGEHHAAVPLVDAAPEPLHAVYARTALPVLADRLRAGELGLRAALRSLDLRWVDRDEWGMADPEGAFARNLNSIDDAARWRSSR